jgi:alkylation response protein AidB-like acyl-CoA dehydrogenase
MDFSLSEQHEQIRQRKAAWLVDAGKSDRDIAHFLSIAKATASEMAVHVSEETIQILGGFGYLKDYAPERYYRDAKQLTIVEGTSEIHRLIISRALNEGLLDWGCDVASLGGFPNDAADKAHRQERLKRVRQKVR